MNNDRRKATQKAIDELEEMKATIEDLRDEEQEAYDNMPESLQDSERGQASQQAYDNLGSSVSALEEAVGYLESAVE